MNLTLIIAIIAIIILVRILFLLDSIVKNIQNEKNEEFEYLVEWLPNPTQKDFGEYKYDSKEFKTLNEWRIEYNLMLEGFGEKGWELILKKPDNGRDKISEFEQLIFKRSSKNVNYKSGFGVDIMLVKQLAKERAGSEEN